MEKRTDKELLKDAENIIRLKQKEIVILRRDLNRRLDAGDSAEKVRKEIFDLAEYSPEPPEWLNQEPGKSSSGIPLVSLNDWHTGERVDPDQVGGLNAFNERIFRQRVQTLFNTVNDLCFNHMTNPNYPGIVLGINGDIITGIIHDELRETNDLPVTLACQLAENHLIALIKGWKKKFRKVAAVCTPGNHGRNSVKPRYNMRVYESYEWLIFCAIEKYFRDDPDVMIYVPNQVDAHYSIFGHRIMQTHGDLLGVKGGDGIIGALGPIARGAMKIGNQQKQAGKDFDTLLIGHFHIDIPRGDATQVLCSPSLIGHNTYSHLALRVRASEPAQSLVFLHHKYGITAQWKMKLNKQYKAKASAPWFQWNGGRLASDLGLDA